MPYIITLETRACSKKSYLGVFRQDIEGLN